MIRLYNEAPAPYTTPPIIDWCQRLKFYAGVARAMKRFLGDAEMVSDLMGLFDGILDSVEGMQLRRIPSRCLDDLLELSNWYLLLFRSFLDAVPEAQRSEDPSLQRTVQLKILSEDETTRQDFMNEYARLDTHFRALMYRLEELRMQRGLVLRSEKVTILPLLDLLVRCCLLEFNPATFEDLIHHLQSIPFNRRYHNTSVPGTTSAVSALGLLTTESMEPNRAKILGMSQTLFIRAVTNEKGTNILLVGATAEEWPGNCIGRRLRKWCIQKREGRFTQLEQNYYKSQTEDWWKTVRAQTPNPDHTDLLATLVGEQETRLQSLEPKFPAGDIGIALDPRGMVPKNPCCRDRALGFSARTILYQQPLMKCLESDGFLTEHPYLSCAEVVTDMFAERIKSGVALG